MMHIEYYDLKNYLMGNLEVNSFKYNRLPLPQSIDEYRQYKNHAINLIEERNS